MADHVLVGVPVPGAGPCQLLAKLAELLSMAKTDVDSLFISNFFLFQRQSDSYVQLHYFAPVYMVLSIISCFEVVAAAIIEKIISYPMASLRMQSVDPYDDLLRQGGEGHGGWLALTCVIAVGYMTFAADVAREVGVLAMFFRTVSAGSIRSYLCLPELLRTGSSPDLYEPMRNVPGMEGFLRRKDLTIFCRNEKDSSDPRLRLVCTAATDMVRAPALILSHVRVLEPCALEHIR
ncbi:unnamed protein product [Musa hybrid cultivar]